MFKNLKSLFIVEDESAKKKAKSNKNKEQQEKPDNTPNDLGGNSIIKVDQGGYQEKQPVSNQNKGGDNKMPASIEVYNGKIKQKYMDILFNAMEAANLDGFDYIEFRKSLQSLKNIPNMDEATRYQSAFAMATTMKATPDNLIASAKHYVNKLNEEEKKFENAAKAQIDNKVGNRQKKIKKLESEIEKKSAEIKRLTEEIAQHQKDISKTQAYISEATLKIEMTRKDFDVTHKQIVDQIQKDIASMETHLQGKKEKPKEDQSNKEE